jgi:hypothetical protein
MATGDIKNAYGSSSAQTITLIGLATSAGLVAGRASNAFNNTSILYQDCIVSGFICVGTPVTVNTVIEVWLIPALNDSPTWPDTFGGTDANVTVSSRGMLFGYGKLLSSIQVDTTTANVKYAFEGSARAVFGGSLPKQFQIWVVHNTGSNLNGTGANQEIDITGVYLTVAP